MKINVVIPVHGSTKRLELAKRVALYYETLDLPGLWIEVVIVRDHGSEWPMTDPPVYVFPQGDPVGRKFNNGIEICHEHGVDGVMIVGSDDLVAPAVFQQILCDDPLYLEVEGVHFYRPDQGIMYFDPNFVCGSGKYFSRAFLDRCDWRPYDDNATKNVDKGPNRFLKPGEKRCIHAAMHDPCVLSVEWCDNMTTWEHKARNAYVVPNKHMAFERLNDEFESRWKP